MKENIPAEIGEFPIIDYLGSGAFGDCYLARAGDGSEVVVKLLRPDHAENGPERIANEIWALKRLHHPSVPKFYANGFHNDRPFVVMERASGRTLREELNRQREESVPMSESRVLMIVNALLDALQYIHSQGIVHRDIKDDNVIMSPSGSKIWLLDFGICKADSMPARDETFWNAGASRFSPPSKLFHPSQAQENADVFSVGVLAYLLLTNNFPWSVSRKQDVGHLGRLMRTEQPTPVRQINSFVSKPVSDFVAQLMQVDDRRRPTAGVALEKLRATLNHCTPAPSSSPMHRGFAIQYRRVMRDPLHGDIEFTEFEWELISTPEFQRLRKIRQLGFCNLVYPGAEHTRFLHSVGAMHVTGKILERIARKSGHQFNNDEVLIARSYALLHDLTHIAYGHTLEDELGLFVRHDENLPRLERLVLSDKSELFSKLTQNELGRELLRHFDPTSSALEASWVRELVASPIGADVVDYIDRDSFFCGLDHKVDSAIFRRYLIDKNPGNLPQDRHLITTLRGGHGFRVDAQHALSSILEERYGLFLKAYTHPAKTSAGAMLGKAIEGLSNGSRSSLMESNLEWLGEDDLISYLRQQRKKKVQEIGDLLDKRILYKPAFRSRALKSKELDIDTYQVRRNRFEELGLFTPEGRRNIEKEIASNAHVNAENVIIYCPSKAPGLQKARYFVETDFGNQKLRDEAHPAHMSVFQKHLGLWTAYAFVNPRLESHELANVGDSCAEILNLTNEITGNRRQLALFG